MAQADVKFIYPTAQPGPHERVVRGRAIPDPYQALEHDQDKVVKGWADEQDALAAAYLTDHTKAGAFTEWLLSETRPLPPLWRDRRGSASYFCAIPPGQEETEICRHEGQTKTCLLSTKNIEGDLNPFTFNLSATGRYLIYRTTGRGDPMQTIHVRDCDDGTDLDVSPFGMVETQAAWLPDESGFFYSRCTHLFVDDGLATDGVYFHRLGDEWTNDTLIFKYPGATGQGHIAQPSLSDDGTYLILHTYQFSSSDSGIQVARLPADYDGSQALSFTTFVPDATCFNWVIGTDKGALYVHTCLDAPNGRIVAFDLATGAMRIAVAETDNAIAGPEQIMAPAKCMIHDGAVYVTYVRDAHETLHHYTDDGRFVRAIDLPELSTIMALDGCDDAPTIFTESFLRQRGAWQIGPDGAALIAAHSTPKLVEDAEITQGYYRSFDGERVPYFILRRAGTSGPVPTLLYAYGGFGQTICPEFTAEAALWLREGGAYMLANIRGGGELGERWKLAAMAEKRQVAFDDFYAAAEFLIETGVTSADQLAIKGVSNGGLLSAVALNQRPDLFAAVITEVPLVDMFWMAQSSIGSALCAEYGDPEASEDAFDAMLSYSPLHNVRAHQDNPPQLVLVAENDRSAQPGQVYKYVAARQAVSDDTIPALLRVIRGYGHADWPWRVDCLTRAEEAAFAWAHAGGVDG